MRALTLKRPWTDAILAGEKDFENRSWPLPTGLFDRDVALHAGKSYDREGAEWMWTEGIYVPPGNQKSPRGIVAVVSFDFQVRPDGPNDIANSPWFCGPYGWHIQVKHVFEKPIPCKGALGFWRLPEDLRALVKEQMK